VIRPRGRRLSAAAFLFAPLAPGMAHAQTACLDEDGPATLAGRLSERRPDSATLRELPAVSKDPFYILDLDQPICLNGSFSEAVLPKIRSVHVFSLETAKTRVLHRNEGRHVSINFVNLFEGHTAHHRRDVVGQVDTVTPAKN
jgi:hypothetical protein